MGSALTASKVTGPTGSGANPIVISQAGCPSHCTRNEYDIPCHTDFDGISPRFHRVKVSWARHRPENERINRHALTQTTADIPRRFMRLILRFQTGVRSPAAISRAGIPGHPEYVKKPSPAEPLIQLRKYSQIQPKVKIIFSEIRWNIKTFPSRGAFIRCHSDPRTDGPKRRNLLTSDQRLLCNSQSSIFNSQFTSSSSR